MSDWRNACQLSGPEQIRAWSWNYPKLSNTGILCGDVVGVDIDVMDAAMSARLAGLVAEHLGAGRLRRVGQAPKQLFVYRIAEPTEKIVTPALYPDAGCAKGGKAQVEILGSGQQFVAFGIHPDTGQPYQWTDLSPRDVHVDDLGVVTRDQLEAFVSDAERALRDAGYKTKAEWDGGSNVTRLRGVWPDEKPSNAVLEDALAHIRNDFDYDGWIRMGMAIYDAFGDGGFDRWERFSIEHPGNNPAIIKTKWKSFAHDRKVTYRTILWEAARRGWRGREPARPGSRGEASAVTLNDFHAYMKSGQYIYVPARDMWPAKSVDARVPPIGSGKDTISASKWLATNRAVEQITWAPGEPEIIKDKLISVGGWLDRAGARVFNQYLPPAIVPGDPDAANKWVEHVHRVYPNDAAWVISYLAFKVQYPGTKINHALVLGGKQGVGKDTLLEPVKQAVGPWNLQEVSPQQIVGRFNGFLKCIILRVSEARDLGEVDRYGLYDHMKTLIAAPPDVLRVDEKNIQEYAIQNVCAVVITTNHKTNGIYLPPDDRRHYVAWSDLDKDDFDPSYWCELWDWYYAGGFEHVTAYLLAVDVTSFDPKAPPPKTAAFWAIADAGRPPECAELDDILDQLDRPDAVVLSRITARASGELLEWLTDRRSRRQVPHRLEDCGYLPVRNTTAKDGLWVVGGKRQAVYGRSELPDAERYRAAQQLGADK
jgi:hypothetical protein